MENNCCCTENGEVKKHKVSITKISIGVISSLLFVLTFVAGYFGYYSFTHGDSVSKQIYSALVIFISLSSFIGFVVIMQLSYLITLFKREISKKK